MSAPYISIKELLVKGSYFLLLSYIPSNPTGSAFSAKNAAELPETVRKSLPEHGQDIYREAFNSAWEENKEPSERRGDATREETAHKIAWSAVKKVYEKDSRGNWVKKD